MSGSRIISITTSIPCRTTHAHMPPPLKHTESSKIIHHKTKRIPTDSVPKVEELR
jgi:hypothetical protein